MTYMLYFESIGSNSTEKLVTWCRFLVVSGAIQMIVSVVAVVDRTFPRSEPANAIILVITVHAGWALVCRRRNKEKTLSNEPASFKFDVLWF